MLRKQMSGMTAQKLRFLLIGGIVALLAIGGLGFWFIHQQLTAYAEDVRQATATAASSSQSLAQLQSLKTKLAEEADTVERTKSIVAESQYYAYQDQIIKDLDTYARRAGVSISSYSFSVSQAAPGTAAPAAPAAPAGGAGATTPGQAASPTVSGLKSTEASITLNSPLAYKNIMNFVHLIEQNLTKMQLSGISITKDSQSNDVAVSSLTIQVYTR